MFFVARKNGALAGIDVLYRHFSVGYSQAEIETKIKEQKRSFVSYGEYLEYIKSIDYIQTLYYNVTYRCALACHYCYAPKNGAHVTVLTNRIIAERLVGLNVQDIVLTGGEPFDHPNLRAIIEDLHKAGLESISILTNGVSASDDLLDLINEFAIEVQISLDGHNEATNAPTRGKGNFERVMNTISRLEQNNAEFSVMNTLTSHNIVNAKSFADFFCAKGIDFGFFIVKKVKDELRPQMVDLLDLYDHLLSLGYDANNVLSCVKSSEQMKFQETGFPITHCGAGITELVVTPNADVYPCLKVLDDDEHLICNLLNNDSISMIKHHRDKTLRNDLVTNLPRCEKCKIKHICGGGCRADQSFIDRNSCSFSQCGLHEANLKFFLENVKI
ncbi:MAG: putative mycofactocin radical SAM maturase MftC [Dehalococcoidia bacterium]|nr:putative mycofactocin radical SAM maturase MftC [Chloroflexota bacterium]